MITLTDSELIPRGKYCVGNKVFWDKIAALSYSAKTNQQIRWNFNDELFSAFDWTIEPENDISYYYTLRCKQIRDEYDYLVLHYSGGSDSHNILTHFYNARIHLDQINVSVPLEYYEKHTSVTQSTRAEDVHNEWYLVIKPDLEWVRQHMPNTKITVVDYTSDMINFDVDQDWVFHVGEHCNPNIVSRMKYYDVVDSKLYDSKRVGHIYGVDKPRVFTHDGQWYFAFLDSILSIISSYKPAWLKHDHVNVVNFYWSPDLAPLLIKQAHLLKRYYESNPQCMNLATLRALSPDEFDLQQTIIKTAIYPLWRNETFQVKKAKKVFFTEFSQWFYEYATPDAKNRWQEGYEYLLRQVPQEWLNRDANGAPNGTVGMWSKWHSLGPARLTNIS